MPKSKVRKSSRRFGGKNPKYAQGRVMKGKKMQNVFTDSNGFVWMDGGEETDDHLTFGGHETSILEIAKSMLPEDGFFLDIGAHVGLYTINLAPKAAHVVAIEANPRTYETLRSNLALNVDTHEATIATVNAAAWDNEGEVLRLVDEQQKETGGSTHCEPLNSEGYGPRYDSHLESTSIMIDPLAIDPDLVKIDVEGAEARVLRGMVETIKRAQPILLIEMHDVVYGLPDLREEVFAILNFVGYEWNEDIRFPEAYYLFARPKQDFDIEVVHAGEGNN